MAVVVCHRDDEGFQRWLDEHPDGNRFCVVQKPDGGKKPLRPNFLEPPFHALCGWVGLGKSWAASRG